VIDKEEEGPEGSVWVCRREMDWVLRSGIAEKDILTCVCDDLLDIKFR
jgi:hypothetical protein